MNIVHLLIDEDKKRCVVAARFGADIAKYVEPFKARYTVIHVSMKSLERARSYIDGVAAEFDSIGAYMREEAEKEAKPLLELFGH